MEASSTLHSTFVSNYVHELGSWTLGFRLFCVDRSFKKEILPFNTKTGEREPSHTPTSRAEKTHTVLYWNLRLFTQFPLLPIKLVIPCHNKLLLNIIPLWWHPSWCLKSPLKRVFRFLRITLWATAAQFFCAASVLSRSTTELGQTCMFHKSLAQHSSVSRLDCFTAFRTGAPCPPVCTFQGLTSDSQNKFTSDLNSLDLILP